MPKKQEDRLRDIVQKIGIVDLPCGGGIHQIGVPRNEEPKRLVHVIHRNFPQQVGVGR